MPLITRKIEVQIYSKGVFAEDYNSQWAFLRQINNYLYLAANLLASHNYFEEILSDRLKVTDTEYYKKRIKMSRQSGSGKEESKKELREIDKEVRNKINELFKGTTKRTELYRIVAEKFGEVIPTKILANLNKSVTDCYVGEEKDIRKGERSLRNYKKGLPIPFSWGKKEPTFPYIVKNEETGNSDILFQFFPELSKKFCKRQNTGSAGSPLTFRMHFGKDKSNNRAIVERIIADKDKAGDDRYKLSQSSLQIVGKDKNTKFFLLLCVDIPAQKNNLDPNKVLGIDLGINFPIYYATNKEGNVKGHIGDRDSFLKQRLAFQRRYKALQSVTCTSGGRGRKKKLQPLESLRSKERAWTKHMNHLYSREIIKTAQKLRAGTIHMEELTGIGKDKDGKVEERRQFILRNWSYFELQTMIQNKAKMAGITVKKIPPAYTSQTCSCCGEKGERKEQAHFKCLNPLCSMFDKDVNADYNAARNIAKYQAD